MYTATSGGNSYGRSERNTRLPQYAQKVCSLGLYPAYICNSHLFFSLPLRFIIFLKFLFKDQFLTLCSWVPAQFTLFVPSLTLQFSDINVEQLGWLGVLPSSMPHLLLLCCDEHHLHVNTWELPRLHCRLPFFISCLLQFEYGSDEFVRQSQSFREDYHIYSDL